MHLKTGFVLQDRAYSWRAKWSVFRWQTGWILIWKLLESVRGTANRRWSASLGWIAATGSTNSCTGCNSWQLSYRSGAALTLFITLLLFARGRDRESICDFTLWSVRANMANNLKSGAFARLLENPPLVGNAANLVMRGNISLTIKYGTEWKSGRI